jgi:predicted metal-dependent phosphoesterase TrpH
MDDLLAPVLEYQPRQDAAGRTRWSRRDAKRIDLHCHSTFSDERLRWVPRWMTFRPLLEPEELYDLAKQRGMDFVTITDHDTIDGCKALLDRRGELPDFMIGEEVTAAFPEDGTVIHVNVFDIDERQHDEIQRRRDDVYALVDYVAKAGRLFVLNHMTWTGQHRPLNARQVEVMLDLFPIFEVLNGTRSYAHNAFTWRATQGRGKVLVAGSDSHTNRVGTTYTLSAGETVAELTESILAGKAVACGAFGTPEQLRDDVWLTLQRNVQRHYVEATSAWKRATCHLVKGLGRLAYPFICLGYHARQNLLIRKSLHAISLPA